jgi:hypothetical protein
MPMATQNPATSRELIERARESFLIYASLVDPSFESPRHIRLATQLEALERGETTGAAFLQFLHIIDEFSGLVAQTRHLWL